MQHLLLQLTDHLRVLKWNSQVSPMRASAGWRSGAVGKKRTFFLLLSARVSALRRLICLAGGTLRVRENLRERISTDMFCEPALCALNVSK